MTPHVEGRFIGAAGKQIYWQGWLPDGDPTGVVVLVHGYAEHSGRYLHVAQRLVSAGYASYAVDHFGHGKSEGPRANVNRMSEVVADIDRVVRIAAAQHPGLPVFLVGHSMGGLLTLDYVTKTSTGSRYALTGVAVSAAAIDISIASGPERLLAKVLSKFVPNLAVTPLDSTMVSRDAQVVADYDSDPLNYHGRIKARTGAETIATAEKVRARLTESDLPILIMHGSGDKGAAVSGSKLLAEKASSKDVTLKLYDGLYHEVFNEPERDIVLGDLVDWLEART